MSRNGPLALGFHALVVLFMMAPLVVVCLVAFTPENTLSLPTSGFSLRWFRAVFERADFIQAFYNSLVLAFTAATLATLIAVPAALAISRYQFLGRHFFSALFLSPIIIPHLVLGVAMLRLFALMGVNGSFTWLMLAHVVIITPYVLRLVLAAAIGIDRSAEQAAESLGAGRFTLFRQITLPMILPGVAGGWLLAFINSFDEVTLSIFVSSPATQTLPVRMYVYATESIDPMMAAVSALVIALTAATMILLDRVYGLDRVLVGETLMALFKRFAETERPALAFTLDGQAATGLLGDTLLTAVLTCAEHLRGSDFSAERRAGFCLMGACQDCWVRLADGRRVRACSTLLEEGLAISREPGRQA